VWDNGLPLDLAILTRFTNYLVHLLPSSVICRQFRRQANAYFDHELYALQPDHELFASSVVTNDDLPSRILSGSVHVRPGVASLTSTGVRFTDGNEVDDIAAVICATGALLLQLQINESFVAFVVILKYLLTWRYYN